MLTDHTNYYLKQEEPYKSCLLALKEIVLFCTKTLPQNGSKASPSFIIKIKMLCYFWKDKKTQEPYIGICRGNEIDHPLLEAGNIKKMKIFRVNPN
tara:strand:- start:8 stop:295 length:288 start_codon:yes stop_codon:yes gene_type:complete